MANGMSRKMEEYLARQRALGYEPSTDGMDEEDFDYVPSWSQRNPDRPPSPELGKEYRPVDRDFAERIYNMFARKWDPNWQMPDLDGPEYSQPLIRHNPDGWRLGQSSGNREQGQEVDYMVDRPLPYTPSAVRTMEERFGPGEGMKPWLQGNMAGSGDVKSMVKLLGNADGGGNGSGGEGYDFSLMDPLYPGNGAQPQSSSPQTTTTPQQPRKPQELWDEHIWQSPAVIMAQTPREKREAVNRILAERQGEFDAAYKEAYGDKAASQWENDRKYTLGAMGDYVSADQLKAFGWQNVNADMVKDLNNTLMKYDITTPARMRHFLAQSAQETQKGLWPTEQEFGDRTYLDRQPYGRTYSGGGNMHTTWEENYRKFADHIGDPRVMEGAKYVAEHYPWLSAGFYWHDNDMNSLTDGLEGKNSDADVAKVTLKINGGDNGLDDRRKYYKELLGIIPD